MASQTAEREKIGALEGLRGVMAWWVVLGHISLTLGWKLPLIDRNTLAVDVFIFLSGFVIALLMDRKREAYCPYLIRRAFRIFPLYLVILLVSTASLPLALSAWSSVPFQTSTNATRLELTQTAIRHLPSHLAVHVPLLQGLVPSGLLAGAPYTIVGQAWSVSLEWQFYLVAPLMVWGLQTPRRAAFVLIVMVASTAISRHFSPAYLGAYIWHFGIGIASYMALRKSEARRFAFCLAALFAALIVYRGGPWQLVPLGIWFVLIAALLAPQGPLGPLVGLLSYPAMARLGELSYSVYFVHMIPLTVVIRAANQLALSPAMYGSLVIAVVLPGTFVLSLLTHRWIEQPGIRAGASLSSWCKTRVEPT